MRDAVRDEMLDAQEECERLRAQLAAEVARRDADTCRYVAATNRLREAAVRLLHDNYVKWSDAGGPSECAHGYAAGVPCRQCDKATVLTASTPPECPHVAELARVREALDTHIAAASVRLDNAHTVGAWNAAAGAAEALESVRVALSDARAAKGEVRE